MCDTVSNRRRAAPTFYIFSPLFDRVFGRVVWLGTWYVHAEAAIDCHTQSVLFVGMFRFNQISLYFTSAFLSHVSG